MIPSTLPLQKLPDLSFVAVYLQLAARINVNYRASFVAQMVKNPTAVWETWVQSLGWKDPLKTQIL